MGETVAYFAVGLVLFFSAHSLQITRGFRDSLKSRVGENAYKAVYSLVSLLGLILIGIGFASYRAEGLIPVWSPPIWASHVALLLNWFALVFVVAAYLPCHMRRILKHPMLVGIKIWATAHLLANGDLGGMILFGIFLFWAVAVRISIKHRPVEKKPQNASALFDLVAVVVGTASYVAIVFWIHPDIFNIPVWPG